MTTNRPPGLSGRAAVVGVDLGEIVAECSAKLPPPQVIAPRALASLRFGSLTRRLDRLGPRPVGELLLKLPRAHGIADDIVDHLEVCAALAPATVAALDGQDWPPTPAVRWCGHERW